MNSAADHRRTALSELSAGAGGVRVSNDVSRLLETMRLDFDEAFYRAQNPDVDFERNAPLVHFALHGWREGRDPAPWFSVGDYLARYEDIRLSGGNPFLHYLLHGRGEGRHIVASRGAASAPSSPLIPPPPASAPLGHFDEIVAGAARGWAFDPTQPSTKPMIELWVGAKLLGVDAADKPRPDVQADGVGDGHIPLPPLGQRDAPVEIVAKVAGADRKLGLLSVSHNGRRLSGVIESVAGLTLSAVLTAETESSERTPVEVLVDGERIATVDAPPLPQGETFRMTAALPAALLDGAPHWFRLAFADGGAAIADDVLRTDVVSAPEDALRRYARSFPGFLSASAARRYAALERQIVLAPKILARQAPGPDRVSPEAWFAQLSVAHAQTLRGLAEHDTKPQPLTALRFEAPDVSIVIPAHNKFGVTYNCLAALLLSPNEATYEIILVDDGSSDLTTKLPAIVKNLVYVRNEEPQGFVRACNRGAEAARGRYLVLLNNDTEPGPGFLDELLTVFATFPDVGLAGAKLVYPNGRLQEAGGLIFPNFDIWNYGRGANPYEPRFNYTRQVDYVSGACIMVAKTVWDQLGGFDEYFAPAYYEDTDLAFRIRALGLKTHYAPFAEVVHFEGLSNGVSTASGLKRFQLINEPKFRRRWAGAVRAQAQTNPELAKDRGVELRALVIDYKTPEPDKDAGSYAAVQEMRLLQALGFKLSFIAQNVAYMGNYTQALQRQGVECLYAPYQTSIEDVIRRRGPEFDVFYITRYNVAQNYIDEIRAAAPRAKIVFCNADLHFLREIRAAVLARSHEALAAALVTRDTELNVMRRVDVALTYSDTEAAVILSHNLDSTKVARCPWVVEVQDEIPPFSARSGLAFLGGFHHPPNEEGIRFFLDEIMPKLRLALPGITLHIYGSNVGETILKLATEDVIVEGYVESVDCVYNRHRLFIAPLRSGAGLKGKVIGALAAGAPTVMTPLAAEGIGISHGVDAMIVDTVSSWLEAIVLLYSDEAGWREMSARARRFARDNFSFERGVETMRGALATAGLYVGE